MNTTTGSRIEEVARRLGLPVRAERTPCPRHPREAPAAILDPRTNRFRCPRCPDVDGDVVDLVAMVRGVDRDEARRWLAGEEGVEIVYQALLSACASRGPELDREREALGVSEATLNRLGARFVADYGGVLRSLSVRFPEHRLRDSGVFNARGRLVFYRHRLLLPYLDGGRVRHVVGLGPGELHPRKRPPPLPFQASVLEEGKGEVVVTSSVRDVVLLADWGCPAVAVPEVEITPSWGRRFAGRRLLVLAGEDPRRAERTAGRLRRFAERVEIARLPGKGSAAEFLQLLEG
jgi:hypothetical protein